MKICVVTGARSEYGLLFPIIKKIGQDSELELQIIASAMHLSPEFGLTSNEIEQDGFRIDYRVDMLLSGDTKSAICKSVGLGVIGFSDAFTNLKPDLVMILGDRFEALAAAQAAMMFRLPIAHIHGGEITEGAMDESIRHAITKMSHLHFCSTEEFRKRIIQMGENPCNVICSGAPGIDNIKNLELLSKVELEKSLNVDLSRRTFLVTFHPETLSELSAEDQVKGLLAALALYEDVQVVITYPNADMFGRTILEKLKSFACEFSGRVCLTESLGYLRYLSILQFTDLVVGNSSSGLIEVPSFAVPTVNIGDRQKGRVRAKSVIDCKNSKEDICRAIELGVSKSFRDSIADVENPYGEGNAADIIISTLKCINPLSLTKKPFFDIGY